MPAMHSYIDYTQSGKDLQHDLSYVIATGHPHRVYFILTGGRALIIGLINFNEDWVLLN